MPEPARVPFFRRLLHLQPAKVRFKPRLGAQLERLIADGHRLAEDAKYLDSEPYPLQKPDVLAAHALRAGPYMAWFGAALSFLQAICGDGHPFVKSFFWHAESCVVDGARKGTGILEGALEAWKAGTLWRVG